MFIKLKLRTGDDVAVQIDKIVTIIDRPKYHGVTIQERCVEIKFDSGYPIHVEGTFEDVFSAIQGATSSVNLFGGSRAMAEVVPPGANFRPYGPGTAAFEAWKKRTSRFPGIKDAEGTLELSIRPSATFDAFSGEGDYVFCAGMQTQVTGTMIECMEARQDFAVGCDQYGVAYTMTDLPEVKD